jgi:hypothetical protein
MFTSSGRASRGANHAFETHSQGFWIEDNVFSDRECDGLIEAAPLSLQGRSRAGARHLMSIPAIEEAAKDVHSSSKALAGEPRRVLHIEYADTLDLGPGLRLVIA